jgi:NAD(P) transhydrogenase subunit alpha
MYARNLASFVALLIKDGALAPDFDDELVAKTCLTHAGDVRFGQ